MMALVALEVLLWFWAWTLFCIYRFSFSTDCWCFVMSFSGFLGFSECSLQTACRLHGLLKASKSFRFLFKWSPAFSAKGFWCSLSLGFYIQLTHWTIEPLSLTTWHFVCLFPVWTSAGPSVQATVMSCDRWPCYIQICIASSRCSCFWRASRSQFAWRGGCFQCLRGASLS